MYIASAIVFAVAANLVGVQVGANVLSGMPDDVSSLNVSQLIQDMFEATRSMDDLDGDINLQQYIRQMFLLIWRAPLFDFSEMHRYDSYQDKLLSGGPKVSQATCGKKLAYLLEKVRAQPVSLVDQSNDYRLFNLLDSFGRPSGSFLRGDITWLGDYDQCIKARYNYDLKKPEGDSSSSPPQSAGSRYCVAHLRWPHWQNTEHFNEWAYTTVKSGVCLPEECDSIGAELDTNKQMIAQLMDVNFGAAFKNFQIGSIYCLPDKESPLTQWWRNSYSLSVAILAVFYLTLVALATIIDCAGIQSDSSFQRSFVAVFSFPGNARALFKTGRRAPSPSADPTVPSDQCDGTELNPIKSGAGEKNCKDSMGTQKDRLMMKLFGQEDQNSRARIRVDLNYLHCTKALAIFVVLKTHVSIGNPTGLVRVYDLNVSFTKFDVFYYCVASLAVNLFFTLTGMFTSYNLFKLFPLIPPRAPSNGVSEPLSSGKLFDMAPKSQQETRASDNPLLRPSTWIYVCLMRYLRIMPLWAAATLVVKYITPYLGSGPMWDYGTSNGTNYYQCTQENWIHLLLGIVNIRPLYYSCTPSAWYLAIDLQCAILIAPLLTVAYIKAPKTTFFVSLTLPIIYFFHFLCTDTYIPDYLQGFARLLGIDSYADFGVFFHDMLKLYYYSAGRMVFYVMGMAAGVLLHVNTTCARSDSEDIQILFKLMDVLRKPILSNWFSIALLVFIQYLPGLVASYLSEEYLVVFNAAVIQIAMGWAVLVCSYLIPITVLQVSTNSLGNSPTIKRFFNWPGWVVLSRINLSLLLLDPLLIGWMFFRAQRSIVLNIDTYVITLIAQTVIIYLFTICVYIVVELPFKKLGKILLNKLK